MRFDSSSAEGYIVLGCDAVSVGNQISGRIFLDTDLTHTHTQIHDKYPTTIMWNNLLYNLLAHVIIILKLLPKFQDFIFLLLAATCMRTCTHTHTHTHTHTQMQEHFLFIIWIWRVHRRWDSTMEHQSIRRLYFCLWKIHWPSSIRDRIFCTQEIMSALWQDVIYSAKQWHVMVLNG